MGTRRLRDVSWEEVERLAGVLCQCLTRHIEYILPVARGGLVPAAVMAYRLKLPIGGIILPDRPPMGSSFFSNVLVVDDVCDTGRTFRAVRERFPGALLVALFAKPAGLDVCDNYGELVEQDEWLVFPWAPSDEINR